MNPARQLAWIFQARTARRAVARLRPLFGAEQSALAGFDECTRQEFSSLAEALTSLDDRLGELGGKAAELDILLQTKSDDHAHQAGFALFRRSVDLAHSSLGLALTQEEEMAQLESGLLQHRSEFARNHVLFRVLVLIIRTEAARTEIDVENRTIFTSVAADMEHLGRQMSTTVETAFAELENIVQEAAAGRRHLQALEAGLQVKARRSIDTFRTELHGLELSLAPCRAANREISRLLAVARGRTGELIMSLQYQDIVRQQLAHVGEGFRDLGGHLDTDGPLVDFAYLHRTARVQANLLSAARQSIDAAGRAIVESGRGLLDTGAELMRQFTGMQQIAAGVFLGNRLGTMFKTETSGLVEISDQSENTNQRVTRLLDRIERIVRVFSGEIARHEYDVQLIALNAQVAAARLEDARALNKLTEETALLSAMTARLTRVMSAELTAMLDRLQVMRTESERIRQTIDVEKAGLAGGRVSVDEKLDRLNHRIQQTSGSSASEFSQAYEKVAQLLPALQFPGLIAPAFAPAENLCSGLLAACAPFATADLTQAGTARLSSHSERYTMSAERAAHDAASSAPAAALAPDTTPGTEPVPAGQAIDGVELF